MRRRLIRSAARRASLTLLVLALGLGTLRSGAARADGAPTVTNLAPTSGPVGTTVAITGTNFVVGATSVSFGATPATVSCASTTSCTATVPAGTGTVGIGLATAGGAAQVGTFTYTTQPTTTVTGPTVTYQPGWNLVGGPSGTLFSNASNPLYTFPAGATAYTSLTNTTPIQGGAGYWAFFNAATTVNLNGAAAPGPASVPLPVNQYVMVGNPTTHAVTMSGADVIYTYNPATPSNPYVAVTTLQPGQGGWALAANGGTLTFSPVP